MEWQFRPQPRRPSTWYHEFVPEKWEPYIPSYGVSTVKSSRLCNACCSIRSWLAENHDWVIETVQREPLKSFEPFRTGVSLKRSYLDGCHLCTLIWHSFDPIFLAHTLDSRLDRLEKAMTKLPDTTDLEIRIYNYGKNRLHLRPYAGSLQNKIIFGSILLKQSGSLPELGPTLRTTCTSGSARRLAMGWIRTCATSHERCKLGKDSKLPRRMLRVLPDGTSDTVRVADTHNLSGDIRYAALSYCWGKGRKNKLLSSNLTTFRSGISIHILPKTVRDAIIFTRAIGIEWLWIDSLCILQDLPEDWHLESSKMCHVYQNAFVTLAALGATDSNEGLFALRDPLIYMPCELFTTTTEALYAVGEKPYELTLGTWPLHRRRWVLQERILSRRTINFGPYLSWHCREMSVDEFDLGQTSHKFGADLSLRFFKAVVLPPTPGKEVLIKEAWRHILASYTDAALTRHSDSVTAISGIITAIQQRTGWKNLAGLWVPFLWSELLWKRGQYSRGHRTGIRPKWSWISISGHVFSQLDAPLRPISVVKETKAYKHTSLNQKASPVSLEVSCIPYKVERTYATNHKHAWSDMITCMDLVDWPWAGRVSYTPDSLSEMQLAELFVPLAFGEQYGWEIQGIAVSPSETYPGAFERVGYVRVASETGTAKLPEEAYKSFHGSNPRQRIILV